MTCSTDGIIGGKIETGHRRSATRQPSTIVGKTSSLEIAPPRSFFGHGTEDLGCKSILSSIFRSTKIALFSNKLNLLIPCGPLAILVDKLTNHHSSAAMNSGLLLMAVMGLLFPAVLHFTHTEMHFGKSELVLSRFSSCVMLVAYGAYIIFQLTNQKNLYNPINEEGTQTEGVSADNEEPDISKWESITWLFILTSLISVLSEYLVNAIEGASVAMNIPVAFISVILLPIVGNAAEHAGAVMFAVKDKLDISLGVAIGSSTQIAMFGILLCGVGWIMGRPMDLNFQLFETATLVMTVLVVAFMLQVSCQFSSIYTMYYVVSRKLLFRVFDPILDCRREHRITSKD
ncbi:UNVERIFIED_CONTAM: Vacuolar cation/proton exchanger 2 [Sesamum latifolium]|uniref:Vacuolar cation/proton exchanger 2 n=1 Tax=Sesamum latifolium TaxID=2727402 RepID=A0AAW2WP34_9LAMI